MVKPFYYIIGCLTLHFIAGWLGAVLLTVLVAGFAFDRYVAAKAGMVGFTLHVFLLTVVSVSNPVSVVQMTQLVDQYLLDFMPLSIPIISTLIPTICYAIAGYISENATRIYYKISVNKPAQNELREWNQSF
jgi:hypothetical protein